MGWSQYGAQYWIRTVLPNPRSTRFLESMGNVEVKKGKEIRRREHVGTRREVGRKEGNGGRNPSRKCVQTCTYVIDIDPIRKTREINLLL